MADHSSTSSNDSLREQWRSRWGFLFAAVGSAVGLGNIWKFPYITGENGGGAFVLIYLACILVVGLPVYILAAVGIMSALDRPPLWVEFGVYLGLGILWALPFKAVFKGVGQADPDAPPSDRD